MKQQKLKKSKKGGADPKSKGKGKAKSKPEKPLPILGIMNLADGTVKETPRLVSFKVPEEGPSFVLYTLEPKKDKKSNVMEINTIWFGIGRITNFMVCLSSGTPLETTIAPTFVVNIIMAKSMDNF